MLKEFKTVRHVTGPLIVVESVEGVAYGDLA